MYRGASELAGSAEAVAGRAFAGSSDGKSYAPGGPLLSSFFNPTPAPTRQRGDAVGARDPSPLATSSGHAAAPSEPRRSLSELRCVAAAELQQMLAKRGVAPCSAPDKDGLAEWVYQHQDLPEVRKASSEAAGKAPVQSNSVAELRKMSVAELRGMLNERGVTSDGKTEKSELVEWVWQHQHLPALYDRSQSRSSDRGGHGYGCGQTKDGTSSRKRLKELAAPEKVDEEDEVAAAKLLTEGSKDPPKPEAYSKVWKVVGAAAAVTAVGIGGVIALTRRRDLAPRRT